MSFVSSYVTCIKQCILALNVANWYLSHCSNVLLFYHLLLFVILLVITKKCLVLISLTTFALVWQVKVWFQNRRTKQKKDQTKDTDKRSSSTSESLATCNILRLLEQGHLLSVPAPPPNPLLVHPHAGNGSLLGSPSVSTSSGVSSSTTPPRAAAGGTFGLSLSSLCGTPPSPRLGIPPPTLCFTMPLLGGTHHELPSGYGCGSSAFEPYMRIERKDGELNGKKTVS